jgi:hypothetical protein
VIQGEENKGILPVVEPVREPEWRDVHFTGLFPAVPHRIPDRGIFDGPDDLLLHPFPEAGVVDPADGLLKVRVVSNRHHDFISSIKSPAFFLTNIPLEYSPSACPVFPARG